MIRLRCEFGPRRRQAVEYDPSDDPNWIEAALGCVALQAHSLMTKGRRPVPLSFLRATGWAATPLTLYGDGILELLSWEENGTGEIKCILRADLGLLSAHRLVHLGHLPRCFVSVLVAPDLLGEMSVPSHSESDLLLQIFAAWLDCSEFLKKASFFDFDGRDRSLFA